MVLHCRYNNALKKANIASLALKQPPVQDADAEADDADDDLQVDCLIQQIHRSTTFCMEASQLMMR